MGQNNTRQILIAALLFILTGAPGLFSQSSPDWEVVGTDIQSINVRKALITPSGATVLQGTNGVYRADQELDGGWTFTGDSTLRVLDWKAAPSGQIFAVVSNWAASTPLYELWRSSDNGATWITINPFFSWQQGLWFPVNDTLVATISKSTSRLSVDNYEDVSYGPIHFNLNVPTGSYRLSSSNVQSIYGQNGVIMAYTVVTDLHSPSSAWLTTDNGESWKYLGFDQSFSTILVRGDNSLIATGADGTYWSEDLGTTWEKLNSRRVDTMMLRSDNSIIGYTFQPNDLYRLGNQVDILTLDSLGQWTFLSTGPALIGIDREDVVWGRSGTKVFRSTDGGSSWYNASAGLNNYHVVNVEMHPATGDLFALVARGDINVTRIGIGKTDNEIYDLYRSRDGGRTWNLSIDSIWKFVEFDNMGGIYVVRDLLETVMTDVPGIGEIESLQATQELLRTESDANQWERVPLNGYVLTESNFAKFWNWQTVISNTSGQIVLNLTAFDTNVLEYRSRQLYSPDGAKTWTPITYTDSWTDTSIVQIVEIGREGDVLATSVSSDPADRSGQTLWRSSLIGDQFNQVGSYSLAGYYLLPSGSIVAYAANDSTFVSEDFGQTWSELNLPVPYPISPVYLNRDTIRYFTNGTSFFSGDKGQTWDSVQGTFDNGKAPFGPLLFESSGGVLSMYHDDRPWPETGIEFWHQYVLVWSEDFGRTWSSAGGDMEYRHATDAIFTRAGRILAGTGSNGLYLSDPVLEVSTVEASDRLSQTRSMQVIPQPANDYVTFVFQNLQAEEGTLRILDNRGRMVRELTNLSIHAGTNRLTIDCGNFEAGIYHCQISVGEIMFAGTIIVQR